MVLEARHYQEYIFLHGFSTHLGIVLASLLISVSYYLMWMDLERKIFEENKYVEFLYTFALSHSLYLVNKANIIIAYFKFPQSQRWSIVFVTGDGQYLIY